MTSGCNLASIPFPASYTLTISILPSFMILGSSLSNGIDMGGSSILGMILGLGRDEMDSLGETVDSTSS
jgi:hypothetical protein